MHADGIRYHAHIFHKFGVGWIILIQFPILIQNVIKIMNSENKSTRFRV